MSRADMDARIDQINRFEAMLVNEGALVLKFWFHLSKDGQKKRLKALESNPRTAIMYASYGIPALRVWDDWQYIDSTRAAK